MKSKDTDVVTPAGPTMTVTAIPTTPTPTWPPTCTTCKFYSPPKSLCRVNAPSAIYGSNQTTVAGTSVSSPVPFWPSVDPKEDWCGEYIAAG